MEVVGARDNVSLIYAKVNLYGRELFAMIDTGATLSAISSEVVKVHNWFRHLTKSD